MLCVLVCSLLDVNRYVRLSLTSASSCNSILGPSCLLLSDTVFCRAEVFYFEMFVEMQLLQSLMMFVACFLLPLVPPYLVVFTIPNL